MPRLGTQLIIGIACLGLPLCAWAKPAPRQNVENEEAYLAYHSPRQLDSGLFQNAWEASGSASGHSFGYEKILVGLEVRGKELIALDIVKSETDYLIPIEQVFPVIGASFELEQGILTVTVPGATVEISARHTYRIDGQLWMGLSVLNEYLRVNGRFDPTKYALTFVPPWGDEKKQQPTARTVPEDSIDYRPDSFSLRQFRLSHEVDAKKEGGPLDFEPQSERSDILGSGAAAGGSWLIEAEKSAGSDWRLDEYFWLKRTERSQWLLGKQTISPSVVAPTVTVTGAQYFYSNQDIPYDPYQDISQSRFFRELGSSVQKIRGTAEPGAIAQLYVNNQVVGETFVRLDGTYDFGEVRSESGLFNEIEVVILDAVNRTELERQNKTRVSSDSLLNKGQMVTSAALGKKGNWLDPDFDDEGEAGMFLYRYGLTDETTVEAGYLLDEVDTKTAGIASSLGSHFVGAYRSAWRNDATTQQLELDGTGESWRLTTFVREQEAGFSEQEVTDTTTANGYFYYTPDPSLRLELIGRYQDRGIDEDRVSFVKPGVFYSPTNHLSVAMRPDFDGSYRTELYYRPDEDSRFRVTHKPDEQTIRFDHSFNPRYQGYMSGRMYKGTIGDRNYQNTIIESAAGFYWQPEDWTRYDRFRFEFNHSNQYGAGFFAEYRTQVMSGVFLDLRLRNADPQFDGGFSAFARISMDFAIAGDRLVPATRRNSYDTQGTIAGTLNTGSDQCDIEHVSVLINGINYKVPVQDCTFYLERVTPGIHRVSLDGEFLPIELVPDSQSYIVEVGSSAVTRIDFDVQAKYSAAGQVIATDGEPALNHKVVLLSADDEVMTTTYSDQFGYFRVDGLVNGRYRLQAIDNQGNVVSQRDFEITGDFLFDVNLTIPAK
ncbi:hypothetical protein [Kangiella marina]|uniref:Carboxypeptidase regulatory-like domain-containing protein n=1 Tax=Kangiella marina TaxID=1079178 RepID=A0ABP8IGR0_9GAMM